MNYSNRYLYNKAVPEPLQRTTGRSEDPGYNRSLLEKDEEELSFEEARALARNLITKKDLVIPNLQNLRISNNNSRPPSAQKSGETTTFVKGAVDDIFGGPLNVEQKQTASSFRYNQSPCEKPQPATNGYSGYSTGSNMFDTSENMFDSQEMVYNTSQSFSTLATNAFSQNSPMVTNFNGNSTPKSISRLDINIAPSPVVFNSNVNNQNRIQNLDNSQSHLAAVPIFSDNQNSVTFNNENQNQYQNLTEPQEFQRQPIKQNQNQFQNYQNQMAPQNKLNIYQDENQNKHLNQQNQNIYQDENQNQSRPLNQQNLKIYQDENQNPNRPLNQQNENENQSRPEQQNQNQNRTKLQNQKTKPLTIYNENDENNPPSKLPRLNTNKKNALQVNKSVDKENNIKAGLKRKTVIQKPVQKKRKIEHNTTNAENIDPGTETHKKLMLEKIEPKLKNNDGYYNFGQQSLNLNLKSIKNSHVLNLPNGDFIVSKLLGSGTFAQVWDVENVSNCDTVTIDEEEDTKHAIKVQTGSTKWEFYVLQKLRKLVQPKYRDSIINAKMTINYKDVNFLVMNSVPTGSLQNLLNEPDFRDLEQTQGLILFFAIELVDIVNELHKNGILHGDLKPDNVLLRFPPRSIGSKTDVWKPNSKAFSECGLTLIDFGSSIDISLYPHGTYFIGDCHNEEFKCSEMKSGQPWREQIDYYGICGTIYTLLHLDYMKVVKNENNRWQPELPFKRYWANIWTEFFDTLLNFDEKNPVNLDDLKVKLENCLSQDQKLAQRLKSDLSKIYVSVAVM